MRYSVKIKENGKTTYLFFRGKNVWTKRTALKHAKNYATAFKDMKVLLESEYIQDENGGFYFEIPVNP